jgi:hypothetical protein
MTEYITQFDVDAKQLMKEQIELLKNQNEELTLKYKAMKTELENKINENEKQFYNRAENAQKNKDLIVSELQNEISNLKQNIMNLEKNHKTKNIEFEQERIHIESINFQKLKSLNEKLSLELDQFKKEINNLKEQKIEQEKLDYQKYKLQRNTLLGVALLVLLYVPFRKKFYNA